MCAGFIVKLTDTAPTLFENPETAKAILRGAPQVGFGVPPSGMAPVLVPVKVAAKTVASGPNTTNATKMDENNPFNLEERLNLFKPSAPLIDFFIVDSWIKWETATI